MPNCPSSVRDAPLGLPRCNAFSVGRLTLEAFFSRSALGQFCPRGICSLYLKEVVCCWNYLCLNWLYRSPYHLLFRVVSSTRDISSTIAMSHDGHNSASAQEKGISEAPPAFDPATRKEDAVMAGEEAELIEYKHLTWWYVQSSSTSNTRAY